MSATGLLVWLSLPYWYLLLPAMALHGVAIVTMFAPMHECVHRTAFASRLANDLVGWIAGVLSFYNSTFYRHFHAWHHRYTQERDPELMNPKAGSRWQYCREMTGINFWGRCAIDYPSLALGRARGPPFVPDSARRSIALSMSMQLLVYAAGWASIALGSGAVLYYWFMPVVLAQPFLRALLIVEHTGCSQNRNGLTNTPHDLDRVPDPPPDVEHAVPRRAPPLSRGSVSPIARAAPVASGEAGACRAKLPGGEPGRHPFSVMPCNAGTGHG